MVGFTDEFVGMSHDLRGIKRLDLAVCTPLRLVSLLREQRISLDATRFLVFDEADKLLDLGFAPQWLGSRIYIAL